MGKKKAENPNEIEVKEKPYNKLQWFMFATIPVIFTVLIVLIVLSVAGVNVFQFSKDLASKVPVISSLIEKSDEPSENDFQKEIVNLEGEIKDKETQMTKLESIIETKDKEIQTLDIEKQRLQQEISELKAVQNDDKRAFKDLIKTYETMSAKKAAPIISALPDEQAVKILSSVKTDTLAAILEKMEPEVASRLTQKLTVESEKSTE